MDESDRWISFNRLNKFVISLLATIGASDSSLGPRPKRDLTIDLYSDSAPIAQSGHKNRRPNTGTEKTGAKTKKTEPKKPNCISVSGIQKPEFNSVFSFYFSLNKKNRETKWSVSWFDCDESLTCHGWNSNTGHFCGSTTIHLV
jgi:hypothetical protein